MRELHDIKLSQIRISESLFGEIPNLAVEKADETAQDREKWKKLRPSRRCEPLYGDIAEKNSNNAFQIYCSCKIHCL